MLITIQNEHLQLTVDTLGAQMMSLQSADGTQYLWQGDPKYWPDRSPLLFPFIARLTKDSYLLNGALYHMGIHGFAAASEFKVTIRKAAHLVLTLHSSNATQARYPFTFTLRVIYALRGASLKITWEVINFSDATMPFGIGGHPGFRVPLIQGEQFEDYELKFSVPCCPDRIGFTPELYLSSCDQPYQLEDHCRLPLRHALFDDDAIILKNMAREVTLRSNVSNRGVTVSYPDMPYLGIWHWPKTDAPYVCIEPWSSLPSRQGIVEELTCKSDLIQLAPGNTYQTSWTITPF